MATRVACTKPNTQTDYRCTDAKRRGSPRRGPCPGSGSYSDHALAAKRDIPNEGVVEDVTGVG